MMSYKVCMTDVRSRTLPNLAEDARKMKKVHAPAWESSQCRPSSSKESTLSIRSSDIPPAEIRAMSATKSARLLLPTKKEGLA